MAGSLKTLFQALQASAFLSGVSLAYGEEMKAAQDQALPYVVMVPIGGPSQEPGYARDGSQSPPVALDVFTEDLWEFAETVQFYLWAASTAPNPQPIDHADAVETLRLAVLSALRDQKAQQDDQGNTYYGLAWKPLREDWETMQNAVNRYGRALILTVQVDIPVVMPTPPEATILTTQQNQTVINAPS
jgi:hypothetical protein